MTGDRRVMLDAILDRHSARPEDVFELLGPGISAKVLGLSPAALAGILSARRNLRRRAGMMVCRRIGIDPGDLTLAAALPLDPADLLKAASLFGVALALAAHGRVLARAEYDELAARFGRDAVTFALDKRSGLRGLTVPGSPGDSGLFVAALTASGHPGARIARLRMDLPQPDPCEDLPVPEILADLALSALRAAGPTSVEPVSTESGLAESAPAVTRAVEAAA
jgi:hypothetical protein